MAKEPVVRVAENLTAAAHRKLAARIRRDGLEGIELSIFGGAFGPTWSATTRTDLDFLQHYAGIRRLHLNLPGITTLAPIEALAGTLVDLSIGEVRDGSVSLLPIARCRKLRALGLVRTKRDVECIGALAALRRLSLTGHRIDELDVQLPALEELYVAFTTLRDTAFLERFPRLRHLELLRIKGLSDLSGVEHLERLESLQLDALRQVARLPRLAHLRRLKVLVALTLNGLEDVSTLEKSAIEELGLIGVPLRARDLEVLQAMPSLKRAVVSLASRKETAEVERALGKRAVPTTNELPRYTARLIA